MAIVSDTGLVTATGVGTAHIVLTDPDDIKAIFTVTVKEKPQAELGDADGSGSIDASDAAQILITAALLGAGEDPGLSYELRTASDVDSDGEISAADAAAVLRYAAALGAGEPDALLTNFL